MNHYSEIYIEYLNKVCPDLDADTQSLIISYLEHTNWDNPSSASDFNNIAVIALVEAEGCPDLSVRSLYLETANEALNNGLSLENAPVCAAHLSLLMSMTGQLQQAVELAWQSWINVAGTLNYQSNATALGCIIYLPTDKNYLNHLSHFCKAFFQESQAYRQALMLLSQSLCYASLCFYNSMGMRWLRLAMQSLPDSVDLNLKLGVSSIMGQQWEGLSYIHHARELAPTEAKILQSLYLAYRDLGNLSGADSWLEFANQFHRQNPNDLSFQWATLNSQSPFTYVLFESNLLMAVEASFRSIVTSVLIAEGDWFEKEMEFWRNQIQPGMTVIDVGANVGVYTFSAAQRVGAQGKVLAVEPFSGCVKCLEETCRVNQFDWVKVCAGAASDREGVARLSLSASSELNELVRGDFDAVMESGAFEEIACFTLDSLIEKENLQQVDILKIDAEGHELAVLKGSQKILSKFAPIILYENIAGSQGANQVVAEYLISLNYELFIYQPYCQEILPLKDLNDLQGVLNIIALHKSKQQNQMSSTSSTIINSKAEPDDFMGRFREVISDPLNILIERDPKAGMIEGDMVYLHNGIKVPFRGLGAYYGDFSSLLVINRGVHEPLEEFVFQEVIKHLPSEPIMLELGAYWGHYSMWIKIKYPQASVHLVEPEEINIQAGINNFNRNGFTGTFIKDFVGKNHFQVDEYLMQNKLETVNILHSDIQGFEVEMLEGCVVSLQNQVIDYVFISTHSQELHQQVIDKINYFGYRVEVSSDFEETTSFDGFIFASSPCKESIFKNFKPMTRLQILNSEPNVLAEYLKTVQARSCLST